MSDKFLPLMIVRCIDNKNREYSTEDVPSLLTEGKPYPVVAWGFTKLPNGKSGEIYQLEGFDETLGFSVDRFEIIEDNLSDKFFK